MKMQTLSDAKVSQELEKRHYSKEDVKHSKVPYHPRARRFIAHGHCTHDDTSWRPHQAAMEPKYTEAGPDWKSQLRYIASPRNDEMKNEDLWPEKSTHLRTFDGSANCCLEEWQQYTNGYATGKRCFFNDVHSRSVYAANEIRDIDRFGARRNESKINKRNGIWQASPGDKDYQAPEYSIHFHAKGSTRPTVNFGGSSVKKPDTFVPLHPLPNIPCASFVKQEKQRRALDDINDVMALEKWRPATPLHLSVKECAAPNAAVSVGAKK